MTERPTHKAVSVIHRDVRIFFSRFFSIIVYYQILSRVPCAIQ